MGSNDLQARRDQAARQEGEGPGGGGGGGSGLGMVIGTLHEASADLPARCPAVTMTQRLLRQHDTALANA